MKLSELLKAGKEKIEDLKVPFKVKEAKLGLETKINAIELKIAEGENAVQEEKSKFPLDYDKIIKKMDEKELLQRQLKQLQALQSELF
jgi:hypothetical protein